MESVSCIIPAYNEASRISSVIEAAKNSKYIDQIIVINDGSKDNTEEVINSISGIEPISYPDNKGKTQAVLMGIKRAKNDLILMLDSDLVNLSPEDIEHLIEPVISGVADVSLSLRSNSLGIYKMTGLDFVSGERCFNKNIVSDWDKLNTLPGYGLELYLNQIYIDKNIKLKVVWWPNVKIANKSAKIGKRAGLIGEFKMVSELVSHFGLIKITNIFLKMLALKV